MHLFPTLGVILAILVLSAGCTGPGGTPKDRDQATPVPGTGKYWEQEPSGMTERISGSRHAVDEAAREIAAGNASCLLPSVPKALAEEGGMGWVLPVDTAQSLATALQQARVVEAHPNIVFYETTLDGSGCTFYTLKEGDRWVIHGL